MMPGFGDGPRLVSDLPVVRLAGGIEEGLDMVVLQAFDEPRFADRGVAATLDDLTQEPLEVLLGLVGPGRHVHRVLDRHRAHRLQAPPDFHPEVRWLGRNLVDEEQPPGIAAGLSHVSCSSPI